MLSAAVLLGDTPNKLFLQYQFRNVIIQVTISMGSCLKPSEIMMPQSFGFLGVRSRMLHSYVTVTVPRSASHSRLQNQ